MDEKERLARLEERTHYQDRALKALKDDIKAVVRRLNQILFTLLTALASGFVSLVAWLIKKAGGG